MIFYGDVSTQTATRELFDRIEINIDQASNLPRGIDRHAAWVSALLAAGEMVQGLADAALDSIGVDDDGEPEQAGMALAVALAETMGQSWVSGFARSGGSPTRVVEAVSKLKTLTELPTRLDIRRTEGFAHYAVYPEAFWDAALLPGPKPRRVIGIRSIGTTLAAVVAAALGAPLPLTMRPVGHPFRRETRPGARLLSKLRQSSDEIWAIVDEGPGLSGSSFAAVADRLAACGTALERVVLFPSHANSPGMMADENLQRFWAAAPRRVTNFEALIAPAPGPKRGLAAWVGDVTGDLGGGLVDIAGGLWRQHRYADEAAWPAVDRQNERRKFLAVSSRGTFLLKFTGLGAFGHEKMARAKALATAGFTLEPLAWRHGFLVEPWRTDTHPMNWRDQDRGAFLAHLARYLGFRARAFPARQNAGASIDALWAMTKANGTEALGAAATQSLDSWKARLHGLALLARPVAIDGKLDVHEWLVDARGRWIKTDAVDHCCGHDIIGCQDIAWDVAGAAIAFDLSADEAERLRRHVESESGQSCHPGLVSFFRIAYAAFQVGALYMAREREDRREAERLDRSARTAVMALHREIGSSSDAT